jgi:WD40 repeat protein
VAGATFDASGRLLITAAADGICFWDAEERRLLEQAPLGACSAVLRAPGGNGLYIAGERGLERRAFEFDPPTRRVRLGDAEQLWPDAVNAAALSRDGHTLVAELDGQSSLVVLDPACPSQGRVMSVNSHGTAVSVSPDGKLVATGNWNDRNLTLWDTASGRPATVLPAAMPARAQFSPDGRYLVVGSSEDYRFLATGTWQCLSRLPRAQVEGGNGSIQFSPDSSVVAIQRDQTSHVQLLGAGSWQELATLEEGGPLCFSPDGAKLAVYSEESKMVMIWDLRRVRRQLAAIGLDW